MLTPREGLILLNVVPGLGPLHQHRLLSAFGSPEAVWTAEAEVLRRAGGITREAAGRIVTCCRDSDRLLAEELRRAEEAQARIVTLEDAGYPERLRTIADPPLALYVRGTLIVEDAVAVAIVGSRHASAYGLQCAMRLASDLAERGVTVISGLAVGVDGAAHRGALRARGRTLAVLGSGLSQLYPPEHRELAEEIIERGAVVSEFPMETRPWPVNFPRRNRIISGLSLGVIVVEAASRSGALITADCALEQGREVFAVPGPMGSVTSQGPHALLKQGARLVTSVEDIMEELALDPPTRLASASPARPVPGRAPAETPMELSESARRVLSCVDGGESSDIDAIALRSGLAMPAVSSALLHLELKHLVRQLPGKRFVRDLDGSQRSPVTGDR
jgi:DNA processing protein